MLCPKCGSEISNQALECSYCGASLMTAAQENTLSSHSAAKNPPKKRKKISLIICTIILALLVLTLIAALVIPPMIQNMATVSQPNTTPSLESLKFSNLNNGGLAAADDNGNTYYIDSNGAIHRAGTDGSDTVICEKYASNLTYANGYVYFITYEDTNNAIYSMRSDGSELKALIQQATVSYIFVQDNVLYYIENNGSSFPNRGAIYTYNLDTAQSQLFFLESSCCILSLYVLDDRIYYYGYNSDTYEGFLKYIQTDDLQTKYTVKNKKANEDLNPYTLTFDGDTAYFIVPENGFYIASMNMSDCIPQKLGGLDCESLFVYGHYIYYTTYTNNVLYRLNLQDGTNECVKESGVLSPCCAGGKIYYRDSTTLKIMCVNLDGSNTHQL